MITVSVNKTKGMFCLQGPALIFAIDFDWKNWEHSRKGPLGLLSPRVILTAPIQVPVKVEPYFRCIITCKKSKCTLPLGNMSSHNRIGMQFTALEPW